MPPAARPCDNGPVPPASPPEAERPIRLAVLDDNPFVRDADGRVHPAAALFSRFVETVVAVGPFEPAIYLAPVRDLGTDDPPPALVSVDARFLRVTPTAPFDGIAGYLPRSASLARRNWPVIRDAIGGADLAWIKAPASNAPLAALACRRAGVPRFTWVAGSVRAVVGGQERPVAARLAAGAAGILYDGTTRILERTGPAIHLDEEMFTSVVTRAEVEATRLRGHAVRPAFGAETSGLAGTGLESAGARPGTTGGGAAPDRLRIAWAGRVVEEKGLGDLLAALVRLDEAGLAADLDVVGDGPARQALEGEAARLGVADRVRWHGYVGDRAAYLDALRVADLFVLPSHAEGVPKVVIEAMAAGLPVVATRVGAVPAVLDQGARGRLVPPGEPGRLADAIAELASDPLARATLRQRGLDYAAAHTAEAQAERLVAWMRRTFPDLAWPVGASADAEAGTGGRA